MKRGILAVSIVLFSIQSNAQWKSIHPQTPLHRHLEKAIIPPGSLNFYAVGNNIAVSADKGYNWEVTGINSLPQQISPTSDSYDIDFPSISTGYMLWNNQLFKTDDAGMTWQNILKLGKSHPNYKSSANFQAMYFVDDLTGYAVGYFDKIFKTTNGGDTWDTLKWNNSTTPFRSYSDVFFLDQDIGFVSGYQVPDILMNFGFQEFVMKTTDGGETWESYLIDTSGDFQVGNIQFIDQRTGFVHNTVTQGNDELLKTTDSAKTWMDITPAEIDKIKCAYWINDTTGLVFGKVPTGPKLFKTMDQGQSWDHISLPSQELLTENSISDINFLNDKNGFTVGSGGTIFTTEDGGSTWSLINQIYPQFYSFGFSGHNTGYASPGIGLFKTKDGGATWDYKSQSDSLYIISMDFDSKGNGYFLGYRNVLYRVEEGDIKSKDLPVIFLNLAYLHQTADSIYVSGYSISPEATNTFLKSGDQGQNWEVYNIEQGDGPIIAMDYVEGTFIVATTSNILASDNGGKSWYTVSTFSSDYLKEMVFLNDTTGIVSFTTDELMLTTDRGTSWHPVEGDFSNGDHFFNGLYVLNEKTIYVYGGKKAGNGYYGAIWKSTDSGASWKEEDLPVQIDRSINSITHNENYLYVNGGYSQILRINIDDEITEIEPMEDLQGPKVYPVPAEKQLYFTLNNGKAFQMVRLFNVNGQRTKNWSITTVGDNTYSMDISGIPSGLYILSIITEGGIFNDQFLKK